MTLKLVRLNALNARLHGRLSTRLNEFSHTTACCDFPGPDMNMTRPKKKKKKKKKKQKLKIRNRAGMQEDPNAACKPVKYACGLEVAQGQASCACRCRYIAQKPLATM